LSEQVSIVAEQANEMDTTGRLQRQIAAGLVVQYGFPLTGQGWTMNGWTSRCHGYYAAL